MLSNRINEEMQLREKNIQKITLFGSFGNFVLLLFKFAAGILGNSAAMMADAIHSLSDFLTDIVVLIFVRIAGMPKDENHEFGHGKYETLATSVIGLFLCFVGAVICWSGLKTIYEIWMGKVLEEPGRIALIAAFVSILVKEGLYQFTAFQGKKLQSKVMMANAWHHRSDALSSLGSLIGIGGAILLGPSWRILDPITAIVISVFIVRVAFQLINPSIDELLEKSLPKEDEDFIKKVICSTEGVSDPHNLRTRRIGNYCAIDVHFRMAGDTPLLKAHQTTREIEKQLYKRFGNGTIINTHVEPLD